MKKKLSKYIVSAPLVVLLLGTAFVGFLALAKQMDEIDYEFDFED